MCGIAGYIGYKILDDFQIGKVLDSMSKRGPDGQNFNRYIFESINVYLFHSRLSIIDINERSNQPFFRNGFFLVFNGEIYNYIELRNKLKLLGSEFVTESDTEVLLEAYMHYGENCVDHFEGMWSFAILDTHNNKIMLSRDRFAEKPLYYYQTKDGFYFASETSILRQLLNERLLVNENQILRYLVNGYKSLNKQDETYYKQVKEIKSSTNFILNFDLTYYSYSYWTPKFSPNFKLSLEDAIEGTKFHLLESMKLRLRSDAPIAFCLSGGVDSASLVSIAKKIFNQAVSTYSIIDSNENYNELANIQSTVDDLGCDSYKIYLSSDGNLSRLTDLIKYHDAPIATVSYLIHSMISEKMKQHGVKVSFSGTGADELFTGYYDHYNLHLYEMRDDLTFPFLLKDWQDNIGKNVRNPFFKNPYLYFEDQSIRDHVYLNNDIFSGYTHSIFNESFKETIYTNDSLLRNRMMNEMFQEVTKIVVGQDDLNSMKNSIENRSPFLDKALFEFAYTIPNKYLIKNGYAKYVLRESMSGILNDKVRLDRQKKGFNASLNSLIDFNDKKNKDFLLSESNVFDYVSRVEVERVMKLEQLPNSFSKFIFNFINAKIFLDNN